MRIKRAPNLRIVNSERESLTLLDAIKRYQLETKNKDQNNELSVFMRFVEVVGNPNLNDINRKLINQFIQKRVDDKVSNLTINRTLEKLRALLNKAHLEWEVCREPPYIKLFPESGTGRVRWITRNQLAKLAKRLPQHLADIAIFATETGLRESNITLLRWDQIDLRDRTLVVEGDDILKSDRAFIIPLTDCALDVLMRNRGKHPDRVFTFRGRPIRKASTRAFREAVQSCDLKDFRFHDLRHTWATWHVQRGTPLEILQKLGGWSNFKSVQRYAHYSYRELRPYVDKFGEMDRLDQDE